MTKFQSNPTEHPEILPRILQIARDAVEKDGAKNIRLSKIAQNLDVDESVVNRHVRSMDELLGLVAMQSFQRMGERLERAVRLNPDSRLRALGVAYIDFATEEPQVYNLMLAMAGRVPRPFPPVQSSEQRDTYQILRHAIAQTFPKAELAQRDDIALQLWSTVHGFSTLYNLGHIDGTREKALLEGERLCERVLTGII